MLKKQKVRASAKAKSNYFSLFVEFKEPEVKNLGMLGSRDKIGSFLVE